MAPTHEVLNQSTPFVDRNLYAIDAALREAVALHGGAAADPELGALGARLGSAEVQEWGRLANVNPPVLRTYDRSGNRIDEVEFHPAWHEMMAMMIAAGVHASPWADPGPGAQVARAAKYLLFSQVENGAQCPVTMTFAVVPVIQKASRLAPHWLPRLLSREYDRASRPAAEKRGVTMGMGMTEKQGGSDLRVNTTFAEPAGASDWGDEYRITGHKWFFSAPQCDAHLVLAQTDRDSPAGLSCFFVPRWRRDGTRNAIRVERLKDKLGNKSNASSEVEFIGATGYLLGEIGRGVPTILEMGNHTRLDCVIGSAGQMRAALTHALHHARERSAFGRVLATQPLMKNVLADMALESEAATRLALRLARAYDGRFTSTPENLIARVLTPASKYWVCKRGPMFGAEAMEVLGGNGYVEESPLARFYRELPVNSIWEGSGNIMCLDVLRAFGRTPDVRDALLDELAAARGANAHYDRFVDDLAADLRRAAIEEGQARRLTERIALAMQGALLVRGGPAFVADAFCASRLAGNGWGRAFGTLPAGADLDALVARALP